MCTEQWLYLDLNLQYGKLWYAVYIEIATFTHLYIPKPTLTGLPNACLSPHPLPTLFTRLLFISCSFPRQGGGGGNAVVNCVGKFESGSCPISCGGGSLIQTFRVSIAAANGGTECAYADGYTQSLSCNNQPCRMIFSSFSLFFCHPISFPV